MAAEGAAVRGGVGAQNSSATTRKVPGRPFAKGRSGNPGGRPKGLALYVRSITGEGHRLADFMLSILERSGEFAGGRLDLEVRMQAATWLADRGFGKPVQATEVTGQDGAPLAPLAAVAEIVIYAPPEAQPTTGGAEDAR